MSDPGGETAGVPLLFEARPCDRRPLESVERVTSERHGTHVRCQDDDDRFAIHPSTVAPQGVTSVTISLRRGTDSRPLDRHAVRLERAVRRQDREPFVERLGNEEPIERVPVVAGQGT